MKNNGSLINMYGQVSWKKINPQHGLYCAVKEDSTLDTPPTRINLY